MTFTLYPAIDLRSGRCVRLVQGDFARETVFSDDPVATARGWVELGAAWLHVVDLDAAAERGDNRGLIGAICAAMPVPVQLGGGLRNLGDLEAAFAIGIARTIIGTAAVEEPAFVAEAVARFGERVAVGLDGRDGVARTHGWQADAGISITDLGCRMAALGVARFIYTDVGRDGMLTEPNFAGLTDLLTATRRPVIASGGVATLDHLHRLRAAGAEGAIIGKALYTGAIRLEAALASVG
jgi:phosphoribosylformimino-5-aminoimidazole carboxamide ribotide isomerase